MPGNMGQEVESLTVANNGTESSSFQIPRWAIFCGALFPAMDNGDIGLEISDDETNYYPVLDPVDGNDAVLCTSGNDPGWVDFSDWVRFVIRDYNSVKIYCRFTCASQTSGAVTIKVMFRG
jgi:hypothetical protein